MKTGTRIRICRIKKESVYTYGVYFALSFVFAAGRLMTASYPFGISLVSAVSGAGTALTVAVGAFLGGLRVSEVTVAYCLTPIAVFALRLAVGRWLNVEENNGNAPAVIHSGEKVKKTAYAVFEKLMVWTEGAFCESVFIRMAVASAGNMICGAARCAAVGYDTGTLVGAVVGSVISPVLVLLYMTATDRTPQSETSEGLREAGKCAVAVTLVLSLRGALPYFEVSLAAAYVITLLVSRERGLVYGLIYGVACGAAYSPMLSPMFALSALLMNVIRRLSDGTAICASCALCCVWSLYFTGISALSTVFPTVIISSAILVPLASSAILPAPRDESERFRHCDDTAAVMLNRDTSKKMHTLSKTMSELSGVMYRLSKTLTSPDTEELCELCEASFEASCATCGMQNACFGREADQTSRLQAKMTLALKNDGRVSAAIIPPAMIKRCYSMGEIIDRMNEGYLRKLSEAKLYDRTEVVAADYEVMSEMLREASEYDRGEYVPDGELTARLRGRLKGRIRAESIGVFGTRVKKVIAVGISMAEGVPGAEDIRKILSEASGLRLSLPEFELDETRVIMKLSAEAGLSVRCGRASIAKSDISGKTDGEKREALSSTRIFTPGEKMGLGKTVSEECGDVISAFMTDDGRFFMLISDGMGSGRDAALTSGVCAVFIEKLLKAGASMDTSLKMLNAMMRHRSKEVAATVDLMELDLMNGITRFVKSGAAPSFVLRDGRLFRLQSKTVPIGIVRALDAEMIKFECERGDVIVMLSDGVVKSFEDCPWLYDTLCDENEWTGDPEQMARRIIDLAVKNGAEDDITAGVVIVE